MGNVGHLLGGMDNRTKTEARVATGKANTKKGRAGYVLSRPESGVSCFCKETTISRDKKVGIKILGELGSPDSVGIGRNRADPREVPTATV